MDERVQPHQMRQPRNLGSLYKHKRGDGTESKEALDAWCGGVFYARSPRMRRASWMSLGMIVTRLAWMAHRLVSSKRPTR